MLTETESPERHYWPEFLPSGRAVLFTVGKSGIVDAETSQIAVLDLDTREQRVLIEGGTHPRYVSGYLVYAFNDTLRAVRFDANRLEVLSEPIPVLEGLTTTYSGGVNVDVSDNGSLVYQEGGLQAGVNTLVWVDRDGNEELVDAEPQPYTGVALSPDGGRVVLQVNDPDNIDLVSYDLTRDTPTRFTFDPALDQYPLWTQDGRHVVFASTRDGTFNLYRKAADGTGQVERLTTSDNAQAPTAATPDGRTLLFGEARAQTGIDIGTLSLDGDDRAVTWLLEDETDQAHTHVSPDGRWIAHTSDQSGRREVYVRPFPNVNGGRWQISRNGGFAPRWGPDSRELFFQSSDGPGTPVTLMVSENDTEPAFRPGLPRPLFEGPYQLGSGANPWPYAVSADGQRFFMIRREQGGDPTEQSAIILVQNWIEELRNLFPDSP